MTTFEKQITINASKADVWNVISNLGGVYKFHPGVEKSYYTSDQLEGIGAARVCELRPMGKIKETAINWKNGESFQLKIDPLEKAPPVKNFIAQLKLVEIDANTVEVRLRVDYKMKLGIIGKILNKLVIKSQMNAGLQGLLDGLKVHMEQGKVDIPDMKTLRKLQQVA